MMKIKLSKILIIVAIIIYVLTRLNTILNQGELFDEEAISVPGYHVWSAMADLDFTSDIFAERYEHAPLPRYFFGIFYIIEQRIPIIKNTFDYMYIPEKQMFLERIASMILGLATMYFLYKIANKIFGKDIAIITIFVYSTMPHLIPYSSGVTQESLLIFFSTLFVFIYLKYMDYHSNKFLLLLYALIPYLFYSKQMGIFYTIFIISIFFDFQHYTARRCFPFQHQVSSAFDVSMAPYTSTRRPARRWQPMTRSSRLARTTIRSPSIRLMAGARTIAIQTQHRFSYPQITSC